MKNSKKSAGILLYRFSNNALQFFLVHPGGPFWAKKDAGAWSIPKGEFTDEAPLDAAVREFKEETGVDVPLGNFMPLTPVVLKSGKTVYAWICEGDFDANAVKSNTFMMEWPPKSGKTVTVPEIDKAGWFTKTEAADKINEKQAAFIEEAARIIEKK